jgi:hypothetical protein
VRGPFSMLGISELKVEGALSGLWPVKPPIPNRVVGDSWRSMIPVGCEMSHHEKRVGAEPPRGLGLPSFTNVLMLENAEILQDPPKSSNVRRAFLESDCVSHVVLD